MYLRDTYTYQASKTCITKLLFGSPQYDINIHEFISNTGYLSGFFCTSDIARLANYLILTIQDFSLHPGSFRTHAER
jgi:hypothetical protein